MGSARCTGRSHAKSNTPCQDFAIVQSLGRGEVAVLCDGAGSRRLSHVGARKVAEVVGKRIEDIFDRVFDEGIDDERLARWFCNGLRWELSQLALEQPDAGGGTSATLDDFACTLLAVAVKDNRYLGLHVGDGVVGMELWRKRGRETVVLSAPVNGEHANETTFVTSDGAERAMHVFKGHLIDAVTVVRGFILMSDGPEACLYDKRKRELAPACGKLISECRATDEGFDGILEGVLADRISLSTTDDCSIAILAR